jgi:hypothetical protein
LRVCSSPTLTALTSSCTHTPEPCCRLRPSGEGQGEGEGEGGGEGEGQD